jgi:Na+-transporting NADH:ubiquinone oxidoreductase subunit NqrC
MSTVCIVLGIMLLITAGIIKVLIDIQAVVLTLRKNREILNKSNLLDSDYQFIKGLY